MQKSIIYTALIFLLFTACKNNSEKYTKIDTTNKVIHIDTEQVKQLIYMLPNPSETALAIQSTKSIFTDEYLCPVEYVDRYNTSIEQALSLGIYSADLSFLTMYGYNQKAVDYISAVKKLAEKLGIIQVVNDSLIRNLQENLEDKDKVNAIISQTYSDMRVYFEENQRDILATYMIMGAWIEGLYLSITLIDDIEQHKELVQIILEQKYSLEDLIKLVAIYKYDHKIKTKLQELKELKAVYDNIKEPITKDDFLALRTKVIMIRNSYINEL